MKSVTQRPKWFSPKGEKPFEIESNEQLWLYRNDVNGNEVVSVTIEKPDQIGFYRVTCRIGGKEIYQCGFDFDMIESAFMLKNDPPMGHDAQEALIRDAELYVPEVFIRSGQFLNIPEPFTDGHSKAPYTSNEAISILLTKEIVTAVREFLGLA